MARGARINYAEFGKFLASPEMVEAMRKKAEPILERARATAPVETGRYKASLHIESGVRTRKTTRAYASVTAGVPYAWRVEFGSGDTPKHATLRRALGTVK